MAITLTSQLTDESLDPGSPNDFGTSNATASETDIHLEGSNCAAAGHSGTVGTASPVTADSEANNSDFRGMYVATNIARDHNHLHLHIRDLYPIRNKSIGGVSVYISNGGTAECLYYMTGLDDGYGGGWYHAVVNLSTTDRAAADLGTLPSGNITRVGYAGNISVSKGEDFLQNAYEDGLRYGADGEGVSFYGGTSGARETMLACAGADTASYKLLHSVGKTLFCDGCLTFGVATQTTYIQDSLGGINFTAFTTGDGTTPVVAADYYRIVIADGTTGVTNIDLTDWTWQGVSRALPFRFTVNIGTGDAYTSLRSSYIFGEDITFNSLYTSTGDKFIECQKVDPNGITLNDPSFTNCDLLDLIVAGSAVDGGSTNTHNTAVSVAFADVGNMADIINHPFDNTGGTGHAIVYMPTGAGPFNENIDNLTFTGYGADASTSAAIRIKPVTTTANITLTLTNGSNTPTIIEDAGYTGTFTLVTSSVTTTINVDDNTGADLNGARVLVRADAGGPRPHDVTVTITRSGTVATVTHTAHGFVIGDKFELKGITDKTEDNVVQTIVTVPGVNSYTYTTTNSGSTSYTGTILSTAVFIDGVTAGAGTIADTRSFPSSQPIAGFIRKATTSPRFKTFPLSGNTINSTTGLTINVRLVLDE